MNYKRNIPDNSVYRASLISGIFCLINLGSTTGFNIVASRNILAILSTYMVSIGFVLLRRIRKQELPPSTMEPRTMGTFYQCVRVRLFRLRDSVLLFSQLGPSLVQFG